MLSRAARVDINYEMRAPFDCDQPIELTEYKKKYTSNVIALNVEELVFSYD